jgi:hypothetical protein
VLTLHPGRGLTDATLGNKDNQKMQMTRNLSLATLMIMTGYSFAAPAIADSSSEVTTTTTTGVGKYNVPVSDTTTTQTSSGGNPTEVIKKHTVYTRLSPADASQTITETKDTKSENYGERLKNFRSQLDTAIEKNWVTAAQATDLNSQYDKLVAQEATVRSHSFPKAERDDFEKQMNEFNIRLSGAMSKAK